MFEPWKVGELWATVYFYNQQLRENIMGISWLSWFTDPYRTARLYCLGFVWCPQEWMANFHHFPHEMFIIGGKHHIVRPSISLVVQLCFLFPTFRKHLIWVENNPRWVTRPFPGIAWRDFFSISGNNFVGHFTMVSTVKPMHWIDLNVCLSEHWIIIISASK